MQLQSPGRSLIYEPNWFHFNRPDLDLNTINQLVYLYIPGRSLIYQPKLLNFNDLDQAWYTKRFNYWFLSADTREQGTNSYYR